MALVVTKGYLINRQDYDVFDEILTFINEFGNRFTCFAPGVRKITSKNARALIYGNYLEYEFFYSTKKMSRLKKVTTITAIDFKQSCSVALTVVNDLLAFAHKFSRNLYAFYQEILAEVLLQKDEYILACYAFIKFIKISNLRFETKCCTKCYSEFDLITLSFARHGFVCQNCMAFEPQFSKEELRLVKELLDSENLNSLDKIIESCYEINYEQMFKKLHYEWSNFKRTLIKRMKNKE
ncbi:DNA repair protein RecO [Ureaplasma ceti]|uniref:DNA replication/recombination mediator RecO N-terminal domain-containing protein n=1 Tax=Ureaplasma ceti TaxID=3119530 RepID=A0ABP9U6R5_9BACT